MLESTQTCTNDAAEYVPFPVQERKNWAQSRLELPLLERLLPVPQHATILETGCGTGVALRYMADNWQPRKLIGVDIDSEMLRRAKQRVGDVDSVELIHGDIRDLSMIPNSSVEVVIDFGTIYHIAHSERALAEIERVLKPGGMFIYEGTLSQLLAHPVRAMGRTVNWSEADNLALERHVRLWKLRRRVA